MHNLYKEMHPRQYVLSHWINLLAMIFLALSGLYIHYPIFAGFMGVARGVHFFWMFVLLINLFYRIISAFWVKSAVLPNTREVDTDIKAFLPQKENRHQFWPWVKYYLFLKKEAPISGKYGTLQKIAYAMVPVMILAAAYTGFALWGPTMDWPFFSWGAEITAKWFAGGADAGNNPQAIRIIHYYIMWVILIFTVIHVYLANIYSFAPSRMIFFREEKEFDH